VRIGHLAVLLALGSGIVLAQGDDGAGTPPRAVEGKKAAEQVLASIVTVLESTAKSDTKAATKALRDPSWAVRTFAAIRLGTLGLDAASVRALKEASAPGSKPLAEGAAPLAAADKLVVKADPAAPPEPATVADEGVRIYASLVRNELSTKRAPPAVLAKLVLELPTYAEAANDARARGFIARELLAIGDTDQILKDLGVKTTAAAVADDGKKVYEWFQSNGTYLYFHPADKGLRVDLEARSACVASEKFREKTPWKQGEGPTSPASPSKKAKDVR
jgi:hypothetical protein